MTRFLVVRILIPMIVAACWLAGAAASAQTGCCVYTIDNQSGCTFTICYSTKSGPICYTVTPGLNTYNNPNPKCGATKLSVTDNCGVTHVFPSSGCVDLRLNGCCIHICAGSTGCDWVLTPGTSCRC